MGVTFKPVKFDQKAYELALKTFLTAGAEPIKNPVATIEYMKAFQDAVAKQGFAYNLSINAVDKITPEVQAFLDTGELPLKIQVTGHNAFDGGHVYEL